jgi:branched-chain amino acid transport system permease protein
MEALIAQIINGLSLGSMYVLLVTAFNLLLLVAMIIHFSFPQVVVFSMYVGWLAMRLTGNSLIMGCIAAVGSSILLNILCAPLFQKVMGKRTEVDINSTMVVSLGLGMIITEALSHGFNSGKPVSFGGALAGNEPLFRLGLVTLFRGQLYAVTTASLAVFCLYAILYGSRVGRAFRAIAEDPEGARLVGIPILRTGIWSYALAGALGGVTAVLLALLLGSASPSLGEQVALKVLAVSIIAGLGNLMGGLIVGLLLGVFEAIVQGNVPGTWSNAIAFVLLLAVILIKPNGLFGSRIGRI